MDNLISNAIKFSQPGTTIRVGLARSEESLECSIKDEGPGIPKADRCRLFTEFPKINVYPTGGEKSTGLGLSIVQKIVDAHSGAVHVDSVEGHGTTFCVELPLSTDFHESVTELPTSERALLLN